MTNEEYKKISEMLYQFEKELLDIIKFRTQEMKDIFQTYLNDFPDGIETTESKVSAEILNEQ